MAIEEEIVKLIRMLLYRRCHGLAAALGFLDISWGEYKGSFTTDGKGLYLDEARLRETFCQGSERLCLEVLHMISHCLLGHPFGGYDRGGAVLDLEAWELVRQIWGAPLPVLTEAGKTADRGKAEKLLYVDNHEGWRPTAAFERLARASGELGGGRNREGRPGASRPENWWKGQKEALLAGQTGKKPGMGAQKTSQVFSGLVPVSGCRGDYREILRSFSAFREESRVNPEEFQHSWYLYGLETYGNLPLVEPLEYREERKIEDLVIVIDTSASCRKHLVRIFLEETRGILEQEQLFFRRFCLHILQCDNQIQKDDKIESLEEFEAYLENLELRGGGGTDFGPAFRHVEKLKKSGEFRELKGMLYFTDGCGLYPREEPDYAVYFVMIKGRYEDLNMPDWIHRLVLEERTA